MTLTSESYIFDPRPQFPFRLSVKRYQCPSSSSDDGITLVFTHGTGFHKEQWEPTIEHLFERQARNGARNKIREAWSIDAPNHGDSAVLNEEKLLAGCYDERFPWEDYARSVHAFLTGLGQLTSQGREVSIDFKRRNLVGVGHSMGAISILLTQTFYPSITFKSFVLVDPMFVNEQHMKKFGNRQGDIAGGASKRRDVWPSREDALEVFRSRPTWQKWDAKVLEMYAEYGLRDIPASDPEGRTGVTLKCTRVQEAASFRDFIGRVRAYDMLSTICSTTPVHIAWGAISDYIADDVKEEIVNVAAQGKLASISNIPGTGHLAPQINPSGTADAIWETFSITSSWVVRS